MRTSDKGYSPPEVYAETKLSNLLFTFELAGRLDAQKISGVTVAAAHPGITSTNVMVATVKEASWFGSVMWRFGTTLPVYQDAPTGALPTLYAARVESGDYYGPGNRFEIWGPPKRVEAKSTAHDATAGGKRTTREAQV